MATNYKLDPLQHNVPIVQENGTPTPEFAMKWQQQVLGQTGTSTSISALVAAVAALTELEIGGDGVFITPGPAALADGDITLELSDSGVSAGTYGDATTIPQITVDDKGRVTDVVDVPASGGGGGGGDGAQWYKGMGDRTPYITATAGNYNGDPNNGLFAVPVNNGWYFNSGSGANYVQWDFVADVRMTGVYLKQTSGTAQGTWQLEYSDDAVIWTSIGTTFAWSGTTFTHTVTNPDEFHRYWRINKTSGSTNSGPYQSWQAFRIEWDGEPGP